jgi:hypothetical protein
MQTTTGTLKARAIDKCSLDIPRRITDYNSVPSKVMHNDLPIRPAFAPTMRMTQDGAPDVRPYNVVLRYRSCPARSNKI